ncbi:MAG: hypothetical protein IVW51_03630 [Thermaceae bacterium]|nr:hypothetical protein [Thermaceae bacterium]
MFESLEGEVVQSQAASIHGAVFYDIVLKTAEGLRRLRFQDSFLSTAPKVGERLKIDLLLGNVNGVERMNG